jgi:hypothetical protein
VESIGADFVTRRFILRDENREESRGVWGERGRVSPYSHTLESADALNAPLSTNGRKSGATGDLCLTAM